MAAPATQPITTEEQTTDTDAVTAFTEERTADTDADAVIVTVGM